MVLGIYKTITPKKNVKKLYTTKITPSKIVRTRMNLCLPPTSTALEYTNNIKIPKGNYIFYF